MTEQAIELRDAREQITRLRRALASAIGDRAGRVHQATNEAYWNAARAMCSRCAESVPVVKLPYLDGTVELIHEIPHTKLGKVEENCQAAPIHALIEQLNEAQQ